MTFIQLLLQIDSLPVQTATAVTPDQEKISLWSLLQEGGILMIPLLICSVIMCLVFFEKWLSLRKIDVKSSEVLNSVRDHVLNGNINAAKSFCKSLNSPISRMIDKGLSRIGKPIDHVEKSMENVGKLEVFKLEKNISILSTIASIAPMFGFLGTIFGMIMLFFNIQHNGFSIEQIAGGIYTKMVTSAVGLIIGLVAYVAYRFLNAKINHIAHTMENASTDFIDFLQEPTK